MPDAHPNPVLFVHTLGVLGGAERSLLELATALRRNGAADVRAAVPDGVLLDALSRTGVPGSILPEWRPHRPATPAGIRHEIAPFRHGAASVRRLCRLHPQALLHTHGIPAAILCAVSGTKASARIWHCRDLVLPPRPLLRWLARRCDRIVAISDTVRIRLCAALPAALQSRVVLIPNGIDLQRFHNLPGRAAARAHFGLPADRPIVGMIAQHVPWKRHDLFLDSLAEVLHQRPDTLAVLAGTDLFGEHAGWQESLNDQVRRLDLGDRIRDLGEIDDAPVLLRALDVLVHPAEREPFGRVVCEAMAAGCPVATVAAGGAAELLRHGHTGLLGPPGSAAAMAENILRLLEHAALRQALAQAARQHVQNNFDIEIPARRIAALYHSIRPRRGPGGPEATTGR